MTDHEVEPKLYTTVLREMIRHENDVTNHRIMWLLIGKGLIANAYVGAAAGSRKVAAALAAVGVLLTLSTYVILYKSYHARGYLEFLGVAAKGGTLRDSLLPMMGWPRKRVKGWRDGVWSCSWLGKPSDLVEPYLFLPALLLLVWMIVLVRQWVTIDAEWILPLCALLTPVLLAGFSITWVTLQQREETETLGAPSP
jgi:hypothetical protein